MKVLISSRSFGKINSGAIELLEKEGLQPIINPYGKKLNEQEILDLVEDAVGIIAGTEIITERIMSHNEQLKVISRYGIGLDNIDLKAAKRRNIMVYNTPETPTDAVAELTLTMMLNLLKKIGKVDRNLRKNIWKPEIGNLLSGKTVGIAGLGRIGKKLVQLLQPFNLSIIAHEIHPDNTFCSTYNINIVPFNTLLEESDIITLHTPLPIDMKHLIGKEELQMMKPTALVINTARGGLIDEQVLYTALKNNTIAGAAIDVFEEEPNT